MAEAVLIGALSTAIAAALAWVATPIFHRVQQAMYRTFAGDLFAVEVQTLTDHMSDVSPLFGPWYFTFGREEPSYPVPTPWGLSACQAWAYGRAGEDVGTSIVQVTLQGLTDDAVSIEAPRLVRHRVLARPGTKCFGPGGLGGGGVLPRHYVFEIDGVHITRTFVEDHGRPEAFQLASGETERLIIRVKVVDRLRHEWALRIPYVSRGRRRYIDVLDPAGTVFATNGDAGLEHWLYGSHDWIRSASDL